MVAVLVLTSGLVVGCSQSQEPNATITEDKPSWTEKQAVDYLYEYLVNKAEQLSEDAAEAQKLIIGWGFQGAVLEAFRETIQDLNSSSNLEQVSADYGLDMPIYVDSFKRLASYIGDGWWAVIIGEREWQVNEKTEEIKARNEEAKRLLLDIAHQAYRNSIYNYHIDYLAGWTVTQVGDEGKVLITCPEPQIDILIDKPRKLQLGQSLGECASGFASFFSTLDQDFELISLVKLENGDYRMDFEWIVGETKIRSRTYFVLHNGWFYMISGSAPKLLYQSYLAEFDYAYNSFGFY